MTTALTVQPIVLAGLTEALVAAALSMTMPNNGQQFLKVANGSGSGITVTITAYPRTSGVIPGPGGTPGTLVAENPVIAIAAGATADIGPFPPGAFNDSTGQVDIAISAITTVTVGAFQFQPLTQ
jgi:hypothetical protein